jgi:hypothetical protein
MPTGHYPRAFPKPEDERISPVVANVAHARLPNNDKSQPGRWDRKAVAHTWCPSLISAFARRPGSPPVSKPPYPWLSRSDQVRPAEEGFQSRLCIQRQSARPLFFQILFLQAETILQVIIRVFNPRRQQSPTVWSAEEAKHRYHGPSDSSPVSTQCQAVCLSVSPVDNGPDHHRHPEGLC